jgi:uncharacterized Zn finger protein (UPF0148 family)
MASYTGTAYASQESCWRCGASLWRLEPLVYGSWRFYCPTCQHLTVPRAEAAAAAPRSATHRPCQQRSVNHGKSEQSDFARQSDA